MLQPQSSQGWCGQKELQIEFITMYYMARKSKAMKGSKIQPAPMTLTFQWQVNPSSVSTNYIDLSQVASLVNRRFYRQGLNWAVSGFKVFSGNLGTHQIQKLPNTWVFSNAWEKGFRTWQDMNDSALEDSESVKGRFLDFKIYADRAHHTSGFGGNLLPRDGDGNEYDTGSWIPSEARVPGAAAGTTNAREFIGVGANYPGPGGSGLDAVSLVQGYANSRALPSRADPNTPAQIESASGNTPENWMTAVSNEGLSQDGEVLADITGYDLAPYPFEGDGTYNVTKYPGSGAQAPTLEFHDLVAVTGTTIGNISYLKGGNFPCGLIKVISGNNDETAIDFITMQIDMVPGNHRGYLCEPMTEM